MIAKDIKKGMKIKSSVMTKQEKLDAITKKMYGVTYQETMEKGRVFNGIQGYRPTEKTNRVFKEFLNEVQIP